MVRATSWTIPKPRIARSQEFGGSFGSKRRSLLRTSLIAGPIFLAFCVLRRHTRLRGFRVGLISESSVVDQSRVSSHGCMRAYTFTKKRPLVLFSDRTLAQHGGERLRDIIVAFLLGRKLCCRPSSAAATHRSGGALPPPLLDLNGKQGGSAENLSACLEKTLYFCVFETRRSRLFKSHIGLFFHDIFESS